MSVIPSERGPERFYQFGGDESKDPQLLLIGFPSNRKPRHL